MEILRYNKQLKLDEQKILNLIIDQRFVKLENVFATYYECRFKDLPNDVHNHFYYLLIVGLGVKGRAITEVYDISITQLQRVTKAVETKMKINEGFFNYLVMLYDNYKTKQAA